MQYWITLNQVLKYFSLEREAAEVDRQLEASQIETARLKTLLRERREREAEVRQFHNYKSTK